MANHTHTTSTPTRARSTTSRRGVFALAGSAALATCAVAAPVAAALASGAHADAAVLRLTAEFIDLDRQHQALPDTEFGTPEDDARDAAADAIIDRQSEIADLLLDMPATTLEGHRAVAQCLAAWAPPEDYPRDGDVAARLTAALLRGMTGRVPAETGWASTPLPPAAPNPDAGLLALCGAYVVAWEHRQQAWQAAMAGGEQSVRD